MEDAIGRARLRGALEMPDGGEISDEVIDQLPRWRPDRGGDRRARRLAGAVDQAADRAGA